MSNKILFVDDERMLKMLIEFQFRKEISEQIYQFLFAFNGFEALEIIELNPEIKLVLTDINMPKMDGLTLISRLKEINFENPIIVISAYDDPQNRTKAKELGASAFVNKPINFDELRQLIVNSL